MAIRTHMHLSVLMLIAASACDSNHEQEIDQHTSFIIPAATHGGQMTIFTVEEELRVVAATALILAGIPQPGPFTSEPRHASETPSGSICIVGELAPISAELFRIPLTDLEEPYTAGAPQSINRGFERLASQKFRGGIEPRPAMTIDDRALQAANPGLRIRRTCSDRRMSPILIHRPQFELDHVLVRFKVMDICSIPRWMILRRRGSDWVWAAEARSHSQPSPTACEREPFDGGTLQLSRR